MLTSVNGRVIFAQNSYIGVRYEIETDHHMGDHGSERRRACGPRRVAVLPSPQRVRVPAAGVRAERPRRVELGRAPARGRGSGPQILSGPARFSAPGETD